MNAVIAVVAVRIITCNVRSVCRISSQNFDITYAEYIITTVAKSLIIISLPNPRKLLITFLYLKININKKNSALKTKLELNANPPTANGPSDLLKKYEGSNVIFKMEYS